MSHVFVAYGRTCDQRSDETATSSLAMARRVIAEFSSSSWVFIDCTESTCVQRAARTLLTFHRDGQPRHPNRSFDFVVDRLASGVGRGEMSVVRSQPHSGVGRVFRTGVLCAVSGSDNPGLWGLDRLARSHALLHQPGGGSSILDAKLGQDRRHVVGHSLA